MPLQRRVVRVFSREEEADAVARMRRSGWALQGRLEGKARLADGMEVPHSTLDFTRPVGSSTPRLEHLEAQLDELLALPPPEATGGRGRPRSARLFGWVALAVGTLAALLAAVGVGPAVLDRKPGLAVASVLVLGLPSAYCWRLFSREAGSRARKQAAASRTAESERQAEIERRQVARDRILAEIDRALTSSR